MKTTWKCVGQGAERSLVEYPCSNDEARIPYAEAKQKLLEDIEQECQPLLALQERIKNDDFLETMKLPALKAWTSYDYNRLVVAKTMKRAGELVRESCYGMRRYWHRDTGHWWYHLAYEEGTWSRKRGEDDLWARPLPEDEAQQIVDAELARYAQMSTTMVLRFVGQLIAPLTGEIKGTPYKVVTDVNEHKSTEQLTIRITITDDLHYGTYITESFERPVSEKCVWAKEGF